MRKISRKVIQLKYIEVIKKKENFILVSIDSINNLNKDLDILVYKKGLYKYILPFQFSNLIKSYFQKHTYIDYTLNKENIKEIINNKNIIVVNYNKNLFINNSNILKFSKPNYQPLIKTFLSAKYLLICFIFFQN